MRLEEADEMLGVVKAQPIADHRDGEGVVIHMPCVLHMQHADQEGVSK